MNSIGASELILNPDGSIYHLNLRPDQVARTIITVGDPDRVAKVSKHFDQIECKVQKREFCTHTGTLNGKRLSVISTGIGTDNIDIVFNELDALVNIDFNTRTPKTQHTALQIIRIGTSGALQADIPVDSFVASAYAVGLDNLRWYYAYNENQEEQTLQTALQTIDLPTRPYVAQGSSKLRQQVAADFIKGITVTCPGFYGPQGRQLRLSLEMPDFLDRLQAFRLVDQRITNFEMETAGIYSMSRLLGHEALSLNAILANRHHKTFTNDPKGLVEKLIGQTLERLTT